MIHIDISIRHQGRLRDLTGRAVGHSSIAPGFKPRPGYVRRVFHLSLGVITAEGRPAHLAYLVHVSGSKTATFYSIHHHISDLTT